MEATVPGGAEGDDDSRGLTGASCRLTWLASSAALVAVGATLGTLVRASIMVFTPTSAGAWPWATFCINMVGSFLLGVVLQSLGVLGEDTGWRRALRLTVGTGVLGGFTTYSTFVLEVEQIVSGRFPAIGVAYALVSVSVGIVAAGVGLFVGDHMVAALRKSGGEA